jgi:hypothetical protein
MWWPLPETDACSQVSQAINHGRYRSLRLKEINFAGYRADRLCGLMVRVPGYTTEMYCASCEVRTEFIYVM